MPRLITPELDTHWYTPDGQPRYDATLREARKEILYPSVTAITKMWPKPHLEAWKQEQCVLSALTLPRRQNEPDDAFAKWVVVDSQAHTKSTAEWGSRLHRQCEQIHRGEIPNDCNGIAPWVAHYQTWWLAQPWKVHKCEAVVVNPKYGYAGKLDLCVEGEEGLAIGDVKTRSVKEGKPTFYMEQAMQLVAYGGAEQAKIHHVFSIIINRDKPEPPYIKVWTVDEMKEAWANFLCCLDLWKKVNRFDPIRPAPATTKE